MAPQPRRPHRACHLDHDRSRCNRAHRFDGSQGGERGSHERTLTSHSEICRRRCAEVGRAARRRADPAKSRAARYGLHPAIDKYRQCRSGESRLAIQKTDVLNERVNLQCSFVQHFMNSSTGVTIDWSNIGQPIKKPSRLLVHACFERQIYRIDRYCSASYYDTANVL
jgi:hypothetical protein